MYLVYGFLLPHLTYLVRGDRISFIYISAYFFVRGFSLLAL